MSQEIFPKGEATHPLFRHREHPQGAWRPIEILLPLGCFASLEIATLGDMCQTCQGTYWYDLTEAHKLEDAVLNAIFGGNTQKSREYKFEVLISSCHSMDKSRERLPVFLYSLRK